MRHLPKRVLVYSPPQALLCRSCRLQHRQLSSVPATPPKLPPSSGIAPLASRRLLSVSGPDSAKFLQGIITSSVVSEDGASRSDPLYTGFLTATGRVVNDVFIYPYRNLPTLAGNAADSGFLIEVDGQQLASLAKYIKRYKLRAKISLQTLEPEQATIWQAWDDSASSAVAPTADNSRIVFTDPRAPGLGSRIVQFGQKTPEFDLETAREEAYTVRRYLRGVAEGQDEILPGALPLESNMELMSGIDFHKGCYVGQELTIRTRHRGVVRKRILPCTVYESDSGARPSLAYEPETASVTSLTADMIPAETSIGRLGKKGRSAGKWLKGVGNIGLALCRLEIMTDVVLPGEQSTASYKPEDEFAMTWGEEDDRSSLKIKAFVPDWLRTGLDQTAIRSNKVQ